MLLDGAGVDYEIMISENPRKAGWQGGGRGRLPTGLPMNEFSLLPRAMEQLFGNSSDHPPLGHKWLSYYFIKYICMVRHDGNIQTST